MPCDGSYHSCYLCNIYVRSFFRNISRNDDFKARFQREAEISARLNHPNIVTIYDVGEEPGVGPFLAMEYIEGKSLGKHIREGNLEAESCFGILIQAMRALRCDPERRQRLARLKAGGA